MLHNPIKHGGKLIRRRLDDGIVATVSCDPFCSPDVGRNHAGGLRKLESLRRDTLFLLLPYTDDPGQVPALPSDAIRDIAYPRGQLHVHFHPSRAPYLPVIAAVQYAQKITPPRTLDGH